MWVCLYPGYLYTRSSAGHTELRMMGCNQPSSQESQCCDTMLYNAILCSVCTAPISVMVLSGYWCSQDKRTWMYIMHSSRPLGLGKRERIRANQSFCKQMGISLNLQPSAVTRETEWISTKYALSEESNQSYMPNQLRFVSRKEDKLRKPRDFVKETFSGGASIWSTIKIHWA